MKHGCVSGAVFLSEDHVVHIARFTIPLNPGHRGIDFTTVSTAQAELGSSEASLDVAIIRSGAVSLPSVS